MRFLLKASLPIEAGNAAIKNGTLGDTINSILGEQKPEAAYFGVEDGKRTAFIFLNMENSSDLPKILEPWFLAFNAQIEITPVMVGEDLGAAGPSIGEAVKKYG